MPRLPSHPAAERGVVFHTLLERAARGSIPRLETMRVPLEGELQKLLQEAAARLSSREETAHFASLDKTLPEVEWHNLTRDLLASAEKLLSNAPRFEPGLTGRPQGREPTQYEDLPPVGRFPEVRISAPDLRLAGRMDFVEKLPQHRVVVRDYKTGRVRDREGQVLDKISLQLRLYGLAINAVDPKAEVELSAVEGTTEVQIIWGQEEVEQSESWLRSIVDSLSPGTTLLSRELAQPGPTCTHCAFRHTCPAYLESAPRLWTVGSEKGSMPFDIWGTIVARDIGPRGITLHLTDAAGRRVSIQRLSSRHGDPGEFIQGQAAYFFGLAVNRPQVVRGVHHHPRNFYELPSDSTQKRAWGLAVYTEV
jgi:hypothetical protein